MTRSELLDDVAVLWATLSAPARGLEAVVSRRRALTALLAATLVSLLVALVVLPRIDFAGAFEPPILPDAPAMTPHQLEEAQVQAAKIGAVGGYASAALGPAFSALVTALACWLAFRVAGTRPGLKGSVAVAAHAFLPGALSQLLLLPAVLLKAPIHPMELPRLVPTSLAAFLPASASPAALAAASSVDLFTLWSLALLVIGMARLAGTTRLRAGAVVLVLWLAVLAFLKLLPATMAGGVKVAA